MGAKLETATETASRMVARWGGPPATTVLNFGGDLSANLMHAQPGEVSNCASSAHILAFTIDGDRHHRQWRDGRMILDGQMPARAVNVVPAGSSPRAVLGDPFRILHLYIPSDRLDRIAAEAGLSPGPGPVELFDPAFAADAALVALLSQVVTLMDAHTPLDRLWRESLASAICARLLQRWSNLGHRWARAGASDKARDWRVRRAIDYLDARLADDVGLTEVATVVGLSPTHLATLFRLGTGEPLHRWLMRRRVERAGELLADARRTVTEIAHACGFASSQHMATVFQRQLGVTPSDYRRQRLS